MGKPQIKWLSANPILTVIFFLFTVDAGKQIQLLREP